MGIPEGISTEAAKAMSLQWHIRMRRAWTMSRHGIPPESYAGILGMEDLPDRVAAQMKTEFKNLLTLESRRHDSDDARELWMAMPFVNAPAIRLIWEFFARDGFRHLHYAHRLHTALFINMWRRFRLEYRPLASVASAFSVAGLLHCKSLASPSSSTCRTKSVVDQL